MDVSNVTNRNDFTPDYWQLDKFPNMQLLTNARFFPHGMFTLQSDEYWNDDLFDAIA